MWVSDDGFVQCCWATALIFALLFNLSLPVQTYQVTQLFTLLQDSCMLQSTTETILLSNKKTFKNVNIYTKYTLRLWLNCNTATCSFHSTIETSYEVHTHSMKIVCYMHVYLFQKVFTWRSDVGSVVNWNVLLFCGKVNRCVRKSVYLSTFSFPLLLISYVGTSPSMVNVCTPPASSCILIYIIWSLWEGAIRQIMRVFVPKRVDLLRGWGRPF